MDKNYTTDQLSEINQTVLATFTLPMADPIRARNLYVSKQLQKPLALMDAHIWNATAGWYPYGIDTTKFLMYSAHDFTVAQSWLFMNATNMNFTNVPFASQFTIELHSTQNCTNQSCFWVELFANGERYKFDEDCERPEFCSYQEFLDLLDSRGFIKSNTSYECQCAQDPYSDSITMIPTTAQCSENLRLQ